MACCGCFFDTVKVLFWMLFDPFVRLARCMFPKTRKCIKGEIVLITGAGHGLGKEVAARLAELGPTLVLWDINKDTNNAVATQLRSTGAKVFAYNLDVTNEQDVIRVANRVKQEVGDVTIVVNNAGVFSGRPLVELSSHAVRRCFEVNAMAHFWILQQFLPKMIELDKGHVVSVASIAGHQGVPNMTDYCASKFAASGLMESLYMELQSMGKKNIRLTTINPIIIQTGLISNVKSRFPCLLPLLTAEKTAQRMVSAILKEEEEVFIPARSRHLNELVRCFSRKTRFRILDFVSYGFDPEKRSDTMKTVDIV